MSECCGAMRSSRFCPECGTLLSQEPIFTLLAHCRASAKSIGNRGSRIRTRIAAGHVDEEWGAAAKWQAWADALAALIHEEEAADA